MTVIALEHVSKTYPGAATPAIRDVSLSVHPGELLVLLAPSGSGKTTLLRLIAGFETPDAGVIRIRGEDARGLPPEARNIGMVFQDNTLFFHRTVAENVAFGLHRLPRASREEKTREVIALLGLAAWTHRYPDELSGGQQQRVALARALACDPTLVLLDEPFGHLDRNLRAEMGHEVFNLLRRIGSTTIFVTHDHEEAFAVADRVAVLNEGRLEQHDVPDVIYHLPETPFVAQFVGPADFVPGVVRGMEAQTELGAFHLPRCRPEGAEVMIMIRPDDVDFLPDAEGTAIVIERQFKGSENLYKIALPSGHPVHSSQHSLAVHPVGMRVRLKLNVTHTVVFDRASQAGV